MKIFNKTIFMLKLTAYEISTAHKNRLFCWVCIYLLINVKMPTIDDSCSVELSMKKMLNNLGA